MRFERGTGLPHPSPAADSIASGAPTSGGAALRRVLRRARDAVALNVDEAAVAMTARGGDLADLCASAARVRDAGLEAAGRRGANARLPVSYSRKVFIPVTHLCRDTCHYCTFVRCPASCAPLTWACSWSPTRFSTSPARVPNWVAREHCSRSAIGPKHGRTRRGSGSMNACWVGPRRMPPAWSRSTCHRWPDRRRRSVTPIWRIQRGSGLGCRSTSTAWRPPTRWRRCR
jgi:hypothetical protein